MKTKFLSFKNFIEHFTNKVFHLDVQLHSDNKLCAVHTDSYSIKITYEVQKVPTLFEYDNKIIEVDSLHYLISLHYILSETYVWISLEKI